MSKEKTKQKTMTLSAIIVGTVVVITITAFIICINNILSNAEERAKNSFEVFSKQTSLRFEDMLEDGSNVLHHLKYDFKDYDSLTFDEMKETLVSYRDTWNALDLGVIFENNTAIGTFGDVVFDTWVNPIAVDSHAYGVFISSNIVDEKNVLSFVIPIANQIVDNQECIGYFMNFQLSTINSMLEDTIYFNDNTTFLAITDSVGDTIWRSDADIITNGGKNIYVDLENARFENKGDFEKMKFRLDLNLSGTVVYNFLGTKRVIAYIPMESNNWKLIMGSTYEAIVEQSSDNLTSLVLASSVVIMISLVVIFYLILRQRSVELMKQKAEIQTAHIESQAQAKNEFFSLMSHELRTPLNGIIGMVELVSRYGDDKEKRENYLRKIRNSSDYLVSLINDILDVSKMEHKKITLNYEAFNMKEMCQSLSDIFLPFTAEKSVEFVIDYSELVHECFIGDEIRIKQVIVNLLSNAFKFTTDGYVKCTFKEVVEDTKSTIVIKVLDTGKGMSKEFLERLFEPFEQENLPSSRNKTGTGLGLTICFNLVKLAGGNITVESVLDKGTTFTVMLPLEVTNEVVHSLSVLSDEKTELKGINVLLAEDNELNSEIAIALLTDSKATVVLAKDGQQVCEIFEKSQKGEFDIILMDMQMPKLDGCMATRRIRESNHPDSKTIPIIAMTANALSSDKDRVRESGMNDHLSKPIYAEKMCRMIIKHCKKDMK